MSAVTTLSMAVASFTKQQSFEAGGLTVNPSVGALVALIGDGGGFVHHLRHALAALGVSRAVRE